MTNVLITSAGRRVSLVRFFRHELSYRFTGARVFTAEAKPELSPACREADGWFALPRLDDKAYLEALYGLVEKEKIGLIIPTIDTELLVLSEQRQAFLELGTHVVVSDPSLIRICRDKRKTHTFFEAHDIPVPAYIDRFNPQFPLFVKPYDGSCSKGAMLIPDAEKLTEAHINNERLMFLEAIDRDLYDEYTFDLYYNRNGLLKCVVPRKRIEVRAGEVSKGITVGGEVADYVFKRLSEIPGARGCVTLQLFCHKHEPGYFGIEINPRFGGGYPLSYHAGANFPGWLIDEYLLGKEIEPYFDWETNLLMLRYDEEVLVHGYVA